jgi:hypothetical protein
VWVSFEIYFAKEIALEISFVFVLPWDNKGEGSDLCFGFK